MRNTRIYYAGELLVNKEIILVDEAFQHLNHVLRCKVGDEVILFNGDGHNYVAILNKFTKRAIIATVVAQRDAVKKSPLRLHLAQGICRGEKMDFVVQKAVELGVTEITPIVSQFCNVKLTPDRLKKKLVHWQKVANSACEQCGRTDIVKINHKQELIPFLQQESDNIGFILEPNAQHSFKQEQVVSSMILLVGPEGGFSREEIKTADKNGYTLISLGERILRSETAGIAAISIAQFLWGDI